MKNRGKLPPWIRVKISCGGGRSEVSDILETEKLHTVCQSARCPNLGDCWHRRTATFMILGNACTRNCKFCAVDHQKKPAPLEADEPERVARAAKKMKLKYVVVTSVTRDDLPDGGATRFAEVVSALKEAIPDVGVEVLTPDFKGDEDLLKIVLDSRPNVFNHNVETVERLSKLVRESATYQRSLSVLANAARLAHEGTAIKSGLMVGLGETDEEVETTLRDLREAGVDVLTIGQYLPPTEDHWPLDRYVEPEVFDKWKELAESLGFSQVASAPLVRSSYHAEELMETGNV